jgi:hypothetical protein
MARSFVQSFLLPLVCGGRLHVGRPLGPTAVERLARAVAAGEAADAVAALAVVRREVAARFLPDAAPPALDEATLRLGAALHDLLLLIHPGLEGAGLPRRQARVAAVAKALAALGPPASAEEAVERHSLLARIAEIGRTDSTVTFWLGRETFVGRVPPPRVTALPTVRRVRVDAVRRSWLRDIGVPSVARDAVLALSIASPLGEALDPLRLEPPLAWSRILPVLRAPALGRIVAGRLLEVGLPRAGASLAAALLRFASFQDPPGGAPATPDAVAFALRFLAHLVWLDVLFFKAGAAAAAPLGSAPSAAPLGSAPSAAPLGSAPSAAPLGSAASAAPLGGAGAASPAGGELAAMLTAAASRAPGLVWPRDVPPDGELGRAFAARLEALALVARTQPAPAIEAARGVAAFAASELPAGAAAFAARQRTPIYI